MGSIPTKMYVLFKFIHIWSFMGLYLLVLGDLENGNTSLSVYHALICISIFII